MPIVVTLRLRLERPWVPNGRQLHGLACRLFEAGEGGHAAQVKRFAVWPLMPDPAEPSGLLLRCGWLSDDPSPLDPAAMASVRLGGVPCVVTATEEHKTSFAELAAGAPADSAVLRFHSPTYFSNNGQPQVLPDPRLILGSYYRRWNENLPCGSVLRVDEETWKLLHRASSLARYGLRTAQMDSGHGRMQAGFIGTVSLRLSRDASPQLLAVFAALIRFAAYAGTGAQTTHGFGATASSLDSVIDA